MVFLWLLSSVLAQKGGEVDFQSLTWTCNLGKDGSLLITGLCSDIPSPQASYKSLIRPLRVQCHGHYCLASLESVCWQHPNLSDQISRSVVSDSLRPHESQHARPPCQSPTPGVHSDSHPSSQWCHPAISSSVVSFSSCPQSLPASVFSNELSFSLL